MFVAALLSVCLAPAPAAASGDWPEFRGPGGSGVYSGAPVVTGWGPDKNVAWSANVPGLGWSSPVVAAGKVFLTTAVPDDPDAPTAYSLRALALDTADGKVVWDKELFREDVKADPSPHKKNSHASPTPVTDGEHVWVHFGHLGTACLTVAGEVVWRSTENRYSPVHGGGASPILVDNLLVFPCDGASDPYLAALDKTTGKTRWKTPRGTKGRYTFSFATCLLVEHAGKRVLVSPAAHVCVGVDPATGAELWRVKYAQPGWSLISQPVYAHGLAFVATGYGDQKLLALPPGGSGDVTNSVVWKTARDAPNTPTPVAFGDELYVVSDAGKLTCFDAKTGKVHYAERLAGRAYSSSPVVANGKLYITSEDGVGQVLATGTSYNPLTRSAMNERTFATPAPHAGALYVRTETKLFKFAGK